MSLEVGISYRACLRVVGLRGVRPFKNFSPQVSLFYSAEWQRLGTKSELSRLLSSITLIEEEYLLGKDPRLASVAKRMSWASRRNTSRIEDIACCLLGIFDTNMPLIYGEGKKAFQRLQGEILKASPCDHTLFAWGPTIEWESRSLPQSLYSAREFELNGQELWSEAEADSLLKGMLAESPHDFENSHHFIPAPEAKAFHRAWGLDIALPQLISNELRIELPIMRADGLTSLLYHWRRPMLVQVRPTRRVVLLCSHEKLRDSFLVLPLKSWGSGNFGRTEYLMLCHGSMRIARYPFPKREVVYVAPELEVLLQSGDFLFREPLKFAATPKAGVLYHGDGIKYLSHSAVV